MEYALELKTFGCGAGATILGALLGVERDLADQPAGMRTHMLVAGAAVLLVSLGTSWWHILEINAHQG